LRKNAASSELNKTFNSQNYKFLVGVLKSFFVFVVLQDPNQTFSFAIYFHQFYGPTFGADHSIYIADNSNKNINSHSNIGLTYKYSNIKFNIYELMIK
jgi:hypothetical protein